MSGFSLLTASQVLTDMQQILVPDDGNAVPVVIAAGYSAIALCHWGVAPGETDFDVKVRINGSRAFTIPKGQIVVLRNRSMWNNLEVEGFLPGGSGLNSVILNVLKFKQ